MRFVDNHQRVRGDVVEQRWRRLTDIAPRQVARVVLDAGAITELPDHLDVVTGALLEALRLDQLVGRPQHHESLGQFELYKVERPQQGVARCDVMRLRVDGHPWQLAQDLARERIEHRYLLDLVVEQLHPHRFPVGFRGENIDHVAAYPIARAMEVDIVSLVLEFGKAAQQVALIDGIATIDMQNHLQVQAGVTESVDRRHRRDHDRIGALQQGLGCREAHLFDVLVDRCILLYIGIRGRHIGFGLVIVVIGNEILDRVVRECFAEFAIQLRRQRLVRRQHDGRALDLADHMRNGERLAGSGNPQQYLRQQPGVDAVDQLADRLRLIARRRKG